MSFSSDAKEELSRIGEQERHCMVAELSAIISLCGKVTWEGADCSIILHTENVAVARRFYSLIRNIFNYQPVVSATRHNYLKKNRYYMISVRDRTMVLKILKTLALLDNLGRFQEDRSFRDNPVIQRTCCQRAYLRGAFLSAGSVTDPEKNYHFEIACQRADLADQIRDLFDNFGLDAKVILRKRYYVVYLKEGTMISDTLNIIGAHISLMKFENVRILKDVRNSVNRRVNCEAANINKTVSAARRQIEDIEYIKNTVGLDQLPLNLRDVAYARLEDPEAALKELGEMLQKPLGKSGVNHRLRKLSSIAQNIREYGHM